MEERLPDWQQKSDRHAVAFYGNYQLTFSTICLIVPAEGDPMSTGYYGSMRYWRERRGENLSDTVYSGLYIEVSQLRLLVAKLSHGYRILMCDDLDKCVFSGEAGCQVPIPIELIEAVMSFATADKDFQAGWSEMLNQIQDQSNQQKSGV